MIRSMTGFGRGVVQSEGRTITVELKSVNSRFLEIHARLPRECAELELLAKAKIKSILLRGRVDLFLGVESATTDQVPVNEVLLDKYVQYCRQLTQKYGWKADPDVVQLLRLPKVVDGNDTERPDWDILKPAFEAALSQALNALNEFRSLEGENLGKEMLVRLDLLDTYTKKIRTVTEGLPAFYRDRLAERIRNLLPEGVAGEERILVEAAIYAEKSDISEEMERMHSHIEQFGDLIRTGGDAGRRLDFLLQEMNREANTILSKADLLEASKIGVEMKAEIEKLREQVQNIE